MPQYNEGFISKFLLEGCGVSSLRCKQEMALCIPEVRDGCDQDPITCEIFIQRLVSLVMEEIGMTVLKEVSVELVHPEDPDKSGASAVTIIAESHGAGHSWGEAKAFRFAVDSCKDYSIGDVVDILCFTLRPERCTVWVEEKEVYKLRELKKLDRIHSAVKFRGGKIGRWVTFLKRGREKE